MYFKKIEGEKVYLSPMCTDDAIKYTKWMNDFDVTDKINSSCNVISLESEKAWLEKNSGIGNYQFAIVKQENDELIGMHFSIYPTSEDGTVDKEKVAEDLIAMMKCSANGDYENITHLEI
jgi:hypothetical protein